jgi:hypothetical protein
LKFILRAIQVLKVQSLCNNHALIRASRPLKPSRFKTWLILCYFLLCQSQLEDG